MAAYTPRTQPLTEQQRRLKTLRDDTQLLERLADRTQPLPATLNGKPFSPEQLLRDLSMVYLGMSDSRYPMD